MCGVVGGAKLGMYVFVCVWPWKNKGLGNMFNGKYIYI